MRAGRDFSIEYEGWQERGNFPSFLELRSSDILFDFFYRLTKISPEAKIFRVFVIELANSECISLSFSSLQQQN